MGWLLSHDNAEPPFRNNAFLGRAEPVLVRLGRVSWLLALVGAFVLTFARYGAALNFSFLFDDTIDITRVEGRSYWSLLSSSKGYSYYRPLPFLIWKALRQLQGRYDQATLHLLPLIFFALTGWLLYLLVKRLGAGNWAVFPALLFLTTPFHYQVVPIVGTVFHPLAGLGILISLNLYLNGRRVSGARAVAFHLGAVAATLVALWAHESGVVIAPMIVMLELVVLYLRGERRPSPWVVAHLAATLLFVITWATVDKAPSSEHTTIAELHPKALFFLQGFTYPASAQIEWMQQHHQRLAPGILDVGLLSGLFVFGAFAVAAWRVKRWALLGVPLIGFLVGLAAVAPSLARLSWAYLENSPRLLYLVAIGSALFWGLLPALDFRNWIATWLWRIATITAIVLVVAQSWRFISIRMEMYEEATHIVNQVVASGETYQGQQALYLNTPSWFAQARYEYLYGHYGIQIVPSYIGLDRVIYASSARSAHTDAHSLAWNPDVSGGRYPFGPHGAQVTPEQLDAALRDGNEAIVMTVDGSHYSLRDSGRLQPGQAEQPPDAAGRLGDGIWLGDASVVTNGNQLITLFDWNVLAPLDADRDTVVRLLDSHGVVVATYRGYALGGVSEPLLWQAGDRVEDSVALSLPADGTYRVVVGLESVDGDQLLGAFSASGDPTPGGIVTVATLVVANGRATLLPAGS